MAQGAEGPQARIMRALLINRQEQIVHKFDALDLTDARAKAAAFCLANNVSLGLAILLRRLTYSTSPTVPAVDDQVA